MIVRLAVLLLTVVVLFYPVFLAMRYIPAFFDEPTLISWEYNEEAAAVMLKEHAERNLKNIV